jgi:hypothetical protein
LITGHLALVIIYAVRPKGELDDPIPICLTERLAWVHWLKARQPLALIVVIEMLAPDQRAYPDGEVTGGRDGIPGPEGARRILPSVVMGSRVPALAAA